MPNNWKTYKVGELLKIKHGYAFKGEYFTDEINENVLLTPGNFYSDGGIKFNWDKQKYYKGPISEEYILNEGDLIIALTDLTQSCSILGSTAIVKDNKYKYLHNQRLGLVKDINDQVNTNFLYYVFNSSSYRNHVIATKTGSTVSHTAPERIYNFEFKLPSLQEQQAIASILSTIDDKIENNLAINKTLEEMAMALYKHWFVDFGPFQEGEFVESELGLIPKGWEVKIVKDFGDVITGKTPEKKYPEHFGDVLPFITPTDFKDYGKHIVSANRYISELGIKKLNKNILPINSVIVTCIGSDMGKVALSKIQSLTNQQINSLKSKHFLYMYCFFINNYALLKRMAGDGTTMPIINKSSFENIKVIYPNKLILNDFEKLTNDFDEQILSNTIENQTLTQFRDTLLPKLISGEVRLKEFQEQLATIL